MSLSGASFPLDLLHAEMIRYAREADERRSAAKQQWKQVCDFCVLLYCTVLHVFLFLVAESCVSGEDLEKYDNLVQQAFAHNNAETCLESLGYRVGYVLCERIAKDSPRFATELEIMKFICKDFWVSAFGKQVDNLRTNHQGVYVVQDNKFHYLTSFSEGTQFVKEAAIFLAFPSGLIRGALANLNTSAIVTPNVDSLPSVKFQIHIQPK